MLGLLGERGAGGPPFWATLRQVEQSPAPPRPAASLRPDFVKILRSWTRRLIGYLYLRAVGLEPSDESLGGQDQIEIIHIF